MCISLVYIVSHYITMQKKKQDIDSSKRYNHVVIFKYLSWMYSIFYRSKATYGPTYRNFKKLHFYAECIYV